MDNKEDHYSGERVALRQVPIKATPGQSQGVPLHERRSEDPPHDPTTPKRDP